MLFSKVGNGINTFLIKSFWAIQQIAYWIRTQLSLNIKAFIGPANID